jgi:hypothetical protein
VATLSPQNSRGRGNSKSQAPNSKEISNSKFEIQNRTGARRSDLQLTLLPSFELLDFEFRISLVFGAWNLVLCPLSSFLA